MKRNEESPYGTYWAPSRETVYISLESQKEKRGKKGEKAYVRK